MRERLYLAGYPATPLGWLSFSALMALSLAATMQMVGPPGAVLAGLIVASWLANIAVVHWPWQSRFLCHLVTWVIIWRVGFPDPQWYRALPVALLLAGGVVWEQERRKQETGPA